jgi:hypothetical protein
LLYQNLNIIARLALNKSDKKSRTHFLKMDYGDKTLIFLRLVFCAKIMIIEPSPFIGAFEISVIASR